MSILLYTESLVHIMDYLEIIIKVPVAQLETASAIANLSVPYGIYIEDYSDLEKSALEIAHIDLIDEELIKKDRENAIIHIYFSEEENLLEASSYLTEQLKAADVKFELSTSDVKESDWKDKWKTYFKTTNIGSKLIIRPSWEELPENLDDRQVLTIDPGAAFGTGTHATTRLCLELLEDYANNSKMLDIGCGSGILGIGAALLGANEVVGVDIDTTAVKVANENAVLNKVDNITTFIEGDLADKVNGKYNIVCANIVADAIIELSKVVKNLLENDGVFICSGIIDIRANEVKNALISGGYTIIKERVIDNWFAFAVK